ncbi:T9SS type A sorting domain-containing protein [Putridiphycobacter roseus]|uniref:T9SS type A sorting domain-containing protein n=1 Tax=Putridiphycobacter roseus TaxID=2219161 RepID=UPI001F402C90|nr:T9SS type A sorting domain-containing protein [Putridiphycobacter roseus]
MKKISPQLVIKTVLLIIINLTSKSLFSQYDTLHYMPPVYVSDAIKNTTHSARDHYLILSTNEAGTFQVTITRGDGVLFSDYVVQHGSQNSTGVFNLSRSAPIRLKFNNTGFNVENIFTQASLNTVLDTGGYKMVAPKRFYANIRHISGSQGASISCKGTTAFGTNFFVGFQAGGATTTTADTQMSHFISIMATLNNTNITVDNFNPGVTLLGQPTAGVPATTTTISITLNAGQSYILAQTKSNMTVPMDDYNGIRVVSDKNIVINSGSWTGNPVGTNGRDIGMDQLIPAKFAGDKYALVGGNGSISREKLILISTQPDTTFITFGTGWVDTIVGQGKYKTLTGANYWVNAPAVPTGTLSHKNTSFTSDQPVLVYQTLFGGTAVNTSSMNLIPPLADCVGSDSIYIHEIEQFGSSSTIAVTSPVTSTIKIQDELGNVLLNINPSTENLPGTLIADSRTFSYAIPNSVTDVFVTGDEKFTLGFLGASSALGGAGYMSAFSDRDVEYSTSDPLFIGNGKARLDLCEGNPAYISIEDSENYEAFQWYKNNNPIAGEINDTLQVISVGDYKAIATYCALPLESTLISVAEFGSPGEQGFSKISALFEPETFDGFSNNSNVSEWDEQSKDFNNVLLVTNGPKVKTSLYNKPGYHPIPFYNATNSEYLKSINPLSNLNGSNHFSFFIVLKDSNSATSDPVISFENSSTGAKILKTTTGYAFSQEPLSSGGPINATVDVNTAQYNILAGIHNGSVLQLFANGKAGPVDFGNTTSNTIDIGSHLIIGGGEEGSGKFFNGFVAEILIIDTALNAVDRQIVETYYGVKYGITFDPTNDESGINDGDYVSNNGSVVWDYNLNTAYHNSVSGIGLDECGRLRQWQNKDANTLDAVAIGLGTIANTDGTNPNHFSIDNTYFMWGRNTLAFDSDGVTDFGNTLNGEIVETRVARIWKTQETGLVNSVRIQFNLGLGNNSAVFDLADTRLLVDTDDVFATGATSIAPTSYNNATGIVNFDHDFIGATGYYFSLGSINLSTTPLPITLIDFEANVLNSNSVLCEWGSSSEINNAYYTIEKSLDGIQWDYVGDVKGAGNSSLENNYTLRDYNPFLGLSYYRLAQTDYDGVQKYLAIESVVINELPNHSVNVFPNPANTHVTVISNQKMNGMLCIRSGLGQLVQKTNINGAYKAEIDISHLAEGVYYIEIQFGSLSKVVKLMVQ